MTENDRKWGKNRQK
jgi:hypothetical protein